MTSWTDGRPGAGRRPLQRLWLAMALMGAALVLAAPPLVQATVRLLPPAATGMTGTAGTTDWVGLTGRGGLALAALPFLFWVFRRERSFNRIDRPGFEIVSDTEPREFIPLEDRFQALDFLSKIKTRGALRLSANLNKVTLSIRRYGYLMEDKNFRNALLVNRRRVRRTLLRNGDVLDLGDLTLLYRDNRETQVIRHASITPGEGKSQIKFGRPQGPVRKGTPMLVSDQVPNRQFYITKNLVFIGRSERNDLVIKSRSVYYQHAKIEKVGSRYKLQDLSSLGNTFVNNRRVEQRFLKDGDEISIENHRFKFQMLTRSTKERTPSRPAQGEPQEPALDEAVSSPEDNGDTFDEYDASASS